MTTAHVNAQLLHGDVDPYLETHAKITRPAARRSISIDPSIAATNNDSLPKNQTRHYPDVHKSILRQTYYTHAATGCPPTVRTYRARTQLALFVL